MAKEKPVVGSSEEVGAVVAPVSRALNRDHEIKSRPARRKLGQAGRLSYPKVPGFHTRVVTIDDPDRPNRYADFKDAWWEDAKRSDLYGANCDRPDEHEVVAVGKKNGRVVHGKVMLIPDALRAEDESEKLRRLDAIEAARTDKTDPMSSLSFKPISD